MVGVALNAILVGVFLQLEQHLTDLVSVATIGAFDHAVDAAAVELHRLACIHQGHERLKVVVLESAGKSARHLPLRGFSPCIFWHKETFYTRLGLAALGH